MAALYRGSDAGFLRGFTEVAHLVVIISCIIVHIDVHVYARYGDRMNIDLPTARRDIIAARLANGLAVTANVLADEFGVSEDAIRRDLRALAAEGRCRRVYGGALPVSPDAMPLAARLGESREQKQRLARIAANLVSSGEFLFLDSGSTNLAMVEYLPEEAGLTVATNSVDIAAEALRRQDLRLLVVGGIADALIGGCVDAVAVQAIVQMRFDRAFIGACSVSEDGLAADHFEDATFKRAVIASARRTVVLATDDKIDRRAVHQIAALRQVNALVVGPDITESQRASLDAAGAHNIIVAGRD